MRHAYPSRHAGYRSGTVCGGFGRNQRPSVSETSFKYDDSIVTIFEAAGQNVVRENAGDDAATEPVPGTPDFIACRRSSSPEGKDRQPRFDLGGTVDSNANIMPEVKRRIRFARVCFDGWELEDRGTAQFTLKVRMPTAELTRGPAERVCDADPGALGSAPNKLPLRTLASSADNAPATSYGAPRL